MNRKHYYHQARAQGWAAKPAWIAALVRERWDEAEHAGLVRLRVEPDMDYELVDDDERYRRLQAARVEREGAWGIIAEARCPSCGAWHAVDSCWGFVGEDWQWSGYDTDLMRAALSAVQEEP
jgi:uncharacterized protein YbbK (DUF523 family)